MKQGDTLSSLSDICSHLGLMPEFVAEISQQSAKHYKIFERPKRSGGMRRISASEGRLKWTQRILLDGVLAKFPMPAHVQGCVRGRSTVTNAEGHVNQDVVINIDLTDFFGSVSFDRVSQLFVDHFHFDEEAAEVFARLTVLSGGLPQGAPTSPILANLAALKLDEDLMRLCRDNNVSGKVQYSRYVDDITLSGGNFLVELLPQIYSVIERNGFTPNTKKTKVLRRSTRQVVTGIIVNQKVAAPKTLIRKVRQQLYYCRKWGMKEHCETQGVSTSHFLKQMRGSIAYIRNTNQELATQFTLLLGHLALLNEESPEERNLKNLKGMIDRGEIADFTYSETEYSVIKAHRAAPSALTVDAESRIVVRAFQLEPKPGWKFYVVSQIQDLRLSRADADFS